MPRGGICVSVPATARMQALQPRVAACALLACCSRRWRHRGIRRHHANDVVYDIIVAAVRPPLPIWMAGCAGRGAGRCIPTKGQPSCAPTSLTTCPSPLLLSTTLQLKQPTLPPSTSTLSPILPLASAAAPRASTGFDPAEPPHLSPPPPAPHPHLSLLPIQLIAACGSTKDFNFVVEVLQTYV